MQPSGDRVRFGDFTLSLRTGELLKNGASVRLAPQPARLLVYLVRRAGDTVTRDELKAQLWVEGTFVDHERGINSCIKRARSALGDSADRPRFLETVQGRGYRFIANVDELDDVPTPPVATPSLRPRPAATWLVLAAAGVAALTAALPWMFIRQDAATFEPVQVLVTSFENDTEYADLTETVEYALSAELARASRISVASRQRMDDMLRLMTRPTDGAIDAALGREIALRDGDIDAVVTGRIMADGERVVLLASVLAPRLDAVVGSARREVSSPDKVLAALDELSRDLRVLVSESPRLVDGDPSARLERATTESLEALTLFSRAVRIVEDRRMGPERWAPAIDLLQRALKESPDFALAHVYLAHGYANSRLHELARPHFERALELASGLPPEERYFIEGSYFSRVEDNTERARAAYEALLRLQPDHYWATNNLSILALQDRRVNDYVALLSRRAELRPNDVFEQFVAGWETMRMLGSPERARPYMERALELYRAEPVGTPGYMLEKLLTFPVIERWLSGDIPSARAALTAAERELGIASANAKDESLAWVAFLRIGFGELRRAEELIQRIADPGLRHTLLALTAIARDDAPAIRQHRAAAREVVSTLAPPQPIGLFPHLILAGNSDVWPETAFAKEWSQANRENAWPPGPYVLLARGEAYLRDGQLERAAGELEEGLRQLETVPTSGYLLGVEALARVRRRQGDLGGALAALERCEAWRAKSVPSAMFFWMRLRFNEAELLHELGRHLEARAVEADLERLLQRADSDHAIRRRLFRRRADAVVIGRRNSRSVN